MPLYIVYKNKPKAAIWIQKHACETIQEAAASIVQTVQLVSEATLNLKTYSDISQVTGPAIVLLTASDYKSGELASDLKALEGSDGFTVRQIGEQVFIASNETQGVLYGAHSFLEENLGIIWPRAKAGHDCLYKKMRNIAVKRFNYLQRPCFSRRGVFTCGRTEEGVHLHEPTAKWIGKNKMNTKPMEYCDEYRKYGLFPQGYINTKITSMNDRLSSHPHYFMVNIEGDGPKDSKHESFYNYYEKEAATALAQKIINARKSGELRYNTVAVTMPDSTYFKMVSNGVVLNEQPFTADNGVLVYPQDESYKSTVYFNFLNNVAEQVARAYEDMEIVSHAYIYAEPCPKVELHKNITVWLAPILADEHTAYTQDSSEYAKKLRENFRNWTKVCKKICVYNYWCCFMGSIYSRPITKVVQKNLQWYRDLGLYGVTPEGIVDSEQSPSSKNQFEMNEMYFWQILRLIWNPDEDLKKLTDKFCRLAYGKAFRYMKKYYNLVQKGWDNAKGLVWYSSGGEQYILQFIIEQNLHGAILKCLQKALQAADTPSARQRILPIKNTMEQQISIYLKSRHEDLTATYTELGWDSLVSDRHANYKENPDSEWNKAIPLKVWKDYTNMEDYPQNAELSARLLWDENYLYLGFSVNDDKLAYAEEKLTNSLGSRLCRREDGEIVESYIETYICGNSLNKSRYYGYFSGLFRINTIQYYVNEGAPISKPMPPGFKHYDFIKNSDNLTQKYCFHIQAIAYKDLGVEFKDSLVCCSFVYYNNRYGRAGWKGNGLWPKEKLADIKFIK